MKRFYCETCKRIRRVRRLPVNTIENMSADANAIKYIGDCDVHSSSLSRSAIIRERRPTSKPRNIKAKPVAVASGKKGKR